MKNREKMMQVSELQKMEFFERFGHVIERSLSGHVGAAFRIGLRV